MNPPLNRETPANAAEKTVEKNLSHAVEWVNLAKESIANHTPCFFDARDEKGRSLIIECQSADILSPQLAAFKQSIAQMAAKTTASSEVAFLKEFPQAAAEELFLKPCQPLFADGIEKVNWDLVEKTIETTIENFYLTDLSQFAPEIIAPLLNDLYFFAAVKEKETGNVLGFMICSITPALPQGQMKLIHLSVLEEEQNKGLEKLLLSVIFPLLPQLKTLFCFQRPTNQAALALYQNLEFKREPNFVQDPDHPLNPNYWVCLQYQSGAHL